jgi:hypothetical protein
LENGRSGGLEQDKLKNGLGSSKFRYCAGNYSPHQPNQLKLQIFFQPVLNIFLFGHFGGQFIVDQFFHFIAGVGKAVVPKSHQAIYQVNYFVAFFFIKQRIVGLAGNTGIMLRVGCPFIIGIM